MSKRKADMRITVGMFSTTGNYRKLASRSGYDVHVANATTGVKVMPRVHPETGEVTYEIWATDGRYRGAHDKMVGRLVGGQLDRINPATMEPYDA